MSSKSVKGVIIPRHDTAINWSMATNFIPKKGELIVYDIDTTTYDKTVTIGGKSYPVKSSDKVRFKFGDGETNVNVLPFATTEVDLTGYATEEWVREYVRKNPGGTVEGVSEEWVRNYVDNLNIVAYVDEREVIGNNIELPDVYPIQSESTSLKIISKNRVKYLTEIANDTEVIVTATNDDGIKVSGSPGTQIEKHIKVSTIDLTTPGKYTISVDGTSNDTPNKKCYIKYNLQRVSDTNTETLREYTQLTIDEPITIDTNELNCNRIDLCVYLYAGISTVNYSNSFKVQVEYGEVATNCTPPKSETNIASKSIHIYERNLYINGMPNTITSPTIYVNGTIVEDSNSIGLHYIKGIMTDDYTISFNDSEIKTPLLNGDKFTLIYNVSNTDGNIINPQVVYGHTDCEKYETTNKIVVESDSNGVCTIDNLKYPYCFMSLPYDDNEGYTLQLKYDTALSRNWTEKQLGVIDRRLVQLEENTTPEVDLSSKMDKFGEVEKDETANKVSVNVETAELEFKHIIGGGSFAEYSIHTSDDGMEINSEGRPININASIGVIVNDNVTITNDGVLLPDIYYSQLDGNNAISKKQFESELSIANGFKMDKFGEVNPSDTYNIITSNGKGLSLVYSDGDGSYEMDSSYIGIDKDKLSMIAPKLDIYATNDIEMHMNGSLIIGSENLSLSEDTLQIHTDTHLYNPTYSYIDVTSIEDPRIIPNKKYVDEQVNQVNNYVNSMYGAPQTVESSGDNTPYSGTLLTETLLNGVKKDIIRVTFSDKGYFNLGSQNDCYNVLKTLNLPEVNNYIDKTIYFINGTMNAFFEDFHNNYISPSTHFNIVNGVLICEYVVSGYRPTELAGNSVQLRGDCDNVVLNIEVIYS